MLNLVTNLCPRLKTLILLHGQRGFCNNAGHSFSRLLSRTNKPHKEKCAVKLLSFSSSPIAPSLGSSCFISSLSSLSTTSSSSFVSTTKSKKKKHNKFLQGKTDHDKSLLKMRKWDRKTIENADFHRLRVALVGRPNVGKSTLFNRLSKEKDAIIHDVPGTTRDWRVGQGEIGDLVFKVIDTGGLEEGPSSSMRGQIVAQCERALQEADLVLFMMDARAGVVDMDFQFANWLRKLSGAGGFKTQLVLNKVEAFASQHRRDEFHDMMAEATRLGLGDCLAVSAVTSDGFVDLYHLLTMHSEQLHAACDETNERKHSATLKSLGTDDHFHVEPVAMHVDLSNSVEDSTVQLAEDKEPLQFAIVGQPNVGKSTLLNRLVGKNRVLTGAEPGVTRDAVCVQWEYDGRLVNIVDTAGIQKGSHGLKFQEDAVFVERKAYEAALAAMRYSHVVMLLIDGREGMVTRTELSIANEVLRQGRALVVAVNKCDDIPTFEAAEEGVRQTLANQLAQSGAVTVIPISALDGSNVDHLLPQIIHVYNRWRARISTHHLNDWLRYFTQMHGNPSRGQKIFRAKYITQVKARPPAFTIFTNRNDVPDNYIRGLTRGLREEFDLHGIPLRLKARTSDNPYHTSGKQSRKGRRQRRRKKRPGITK